jgi:hypothetical protein
MAFQSSKKAAIRWVFTLFRKEKAAKDHREADKFKVKRTARLSLRKSFVHLQDPSATVHA